MSTHRLAVVPASGLDIRDANEERRITLRAAAKSDPTGAIARGLNIDQRVVVMGLRDRDSIAFHAVRELIGRGAYVGVTFWNERIRDKVQPIADELGVDWCLPCDVAEEGEIKALFSTIAEHDGWGGRCLDGVVHSIAFATQMASVAEMTTADALKTLQISSLSFSQAAAAARPMMKRGSIAIALGYSGADRLERGYDGAIGGAKALLDYVMRSLAMNLGEVDMIRCALVSPAPMPTRAASGLPAFHRMYGQFLQQSPMHQPVEGHHVGHAIAQLIATGAERVSGVNHLIDGGRNVVA